MNEKWNEDTAEKLEVEDGKLQSGSERTSLHHQHSSSDLLVQRPGVVAVFFFYKWMSR